MKRPFNPIKARMFLPQDVSDLGQIDWAELPTPSLKDLLSRYRRITDQIDAELRRRAAAVALEITKEIA